MRNCLFWKGQKQKDKDACDNIKSKWYFSSEVYMELIHLGFTLISYGRNKLSLYHVKAAVGKIEENLGLSQNCKNTTFRSLPPSSKKVF